MSDPLLSRGCGSRRAAADDSTSSVLPSAIERDVLIAFTTSPPSSASLAPPTKSGNTVFHLQNLDPKYTPIDFEVDLLSSGEELSVPKVHHWSSYFIAGTKVRIPCA